MSVDTEIPLDLSDGIDVDYVDSPDVEPEIDIADTPDHDPLYSTLTGKQYKTERGKKIAESRFRNRNGDSPTARATPSRKGLEKRLQSLYETVGAGVGLVSPPDGQVIIDAAPVCAAAVSEWADSDPRVRAALERLLTGSAMSKVVMAHMPIAIGIMANHGVNPLARLLPSPVQYE